MMRHILMFGIGLEIRDALKLFYWSSALDDFYHKWGRAYFLIISFINCCAVSGAWIETKEVITCRLGCSSAFVLRYVATIAR